jgi:hypothetical protein
MFEARNVEIYGIRQLVEGVRMAQGLHFTDSYKTNIEDPETMETAEYQFILGDEDADYIREFCRKRPDRGNPNFDIRGMVTIYMDVRASLSWFFDLATRLMLSVTIIADGASWRKVRMTYLDIAQLLSSIRREGPQASADWLQFKHWAETELPYYEELLSEVEATYELGGDVGE